MPLPVPGESSSTCPNLLDQWILHWQASGHHLVRRVREHRVVALVYQRVRLKFPPLEPLLRPLAVEYQLRALGQAQQLLDLVQEFRQARVPVLPLKGPVLSYQLWQDVALRPSVDLDLLVRPRDLTRSWDILRNLGYRMIAPALHGLPQHLQARVLGRVHHTVWQPPEPFQTPVELHWRPLDPRWAVRLTAAALLGRAQSTVLMGRPVATLHPKDLLLYLALHGTKHQWNRLRWLCDFVQAWVRWGPLVDPGDLLADARKMGALKPLLLGFALMARVGAQHLPEPVASELRRFPYLWRLARDLLEDLQDGRVRRPGALSQIAYEARMMEGGRGFVLIRGLRLLVQRFLAPTVADFRAVRFPLRWIPLYYLIRPLRWLSQKFPGFAGSWSHDA